MNYVKSLASDFKVASLFRSAMYPTKTPKSQSGLLPIDFFVPFVPLWAKFTTNFTIHKGGKNGQKREYFIRL